MSGLLLIVEDSPTQSALLSYILENAGFRVVAARDGNEGLAVARREKPALIISDVEMPGMDGYAMCRAVKQDPLLGNTPVVLLTSLSDPADVLRGLDAQADYYLTKPYDDEYLLSQVRAIIAQPRTANGDGDGHTPVDVVVGAEHCSVTAGRNQVLNLLLSTYGSAVQRNRELVRAQQQLQERNRLLHKAVEAEHAAQEAMRRAQSQLIQAEKLAGLGQMVAGVAHEINNPLAFVSNNVAVLQRDTTSLESLIHLYREGEAALDVDQHYSELHSRIRALCDSIDVEYTLSNLQDLLKRSREGLKRIQQIVLDLRAFARLDESDLSQFDLNTGISSTVNIVAMRAKEKDVQLELKPQTIPTVLCYPAKINQVIMNLVANAIDASPSGGTVTIQTGAFDGTVRVDVLDQGPGIKPELRDRIFEPFFTTKPIGQGVGLGLSISYSIVQDHGGRIEVDSGNGQPTRFSVYLPVRPKALPPSAENGGPAKPRLGEFQHDDQ